jgi:hypothetical protein
VSLPLVIWDIHNERVIASMGMAWDIGAPIWPYQTPDILLRFLNFPAYILAQPVVNLLRFFGPRAYLFELPAYVFWWWFLRRGLNRKLVPTRQRGNWPTRVALMILSVLFIVAAVIGFHDSFRWWFRYAGQFRGTTILIMLRFLTPALWFTTFGFWTAITAKKLHRLDRS